MMLVLLLVNPLMLSYDIRPVKAQPTTIRVPEDYPAIQEAINAATPGDTISVSNGTYYEHITVNKSLTLAGESRCTTIIDGSLNGTIIELVADNVQLSEFTIRNGKRGILIHSGGNTLSHNNITMNEFEGVAVENSIGNVVANNMIGFNGEDGIYMINTSNTALLSNLIASNNWTGVHIEASSSDIIYNNTLCNNTIFGLRLDDSTNMSVVGNTLYWNAKAGVNFFNLTNSPFHHNNFLNSTEQIDSDDSLNCWDDGYPSGGNYWIDYHDTDSYSGQGQDETGSDGIGDVAYVNIDNVNQDNYPLSGPICFFDAGVWNGASCSVHVISNSTVSKFQLSEAKKTISFDIAGDAGLGFCRVTIPNIIVQDLWKGNYEVLVDGESPLVTDRWTDETYTYVYFTYLHSERTVVIQSSDYTPPIISVISPENKSYSAENVSLVFAVNELPSWIGYSLDDQMNVTIFGNTTVVALSDGAHVITMYSNDTVGNMGVSDTVFFTVDTSFPDVRLLSPENRTYTASSVSLSFSINESTSWIGYSLDGQENVTITGNTTLSGLTAGLHSLCVYANDTTGNMGVSESVYFTIEIQQEAFAPWVAVIAVTISVVVPAVSVYFLQVRKKTKE